jgi:hypothetical protein
MTARPVELPIASTEGPPGTFLRNRIVQAGIAVWILLAATIPFLAHGVVPFDQPSLAQEPYATRLYFLITSPLVEFIFVAVAYAITYRRKIVIAERAPARGAAMREVMGLLIYGATALIAGQVLGRAIGVHGIGQHLTGSLFGLGDYLVTPRDALVWASYNFVFYAVLPYLYFRRRGYTPQQLCLRSNNALNDTAVIFGVLGTGVVAHLPGLALWRLDAHQLVVGVSLTFVLCFLGTAVPVMIFLCAILVPRYYRLTGSTAATCVLSAFTYAAMHLAEYWTRYDSPTDAALSVMFVLLTFGGPGLVKGYLTVRTSNAWVHLWGFHAIWPHVTGDTPTFVKLFGIR